MDYLRDIQDPHTIARLLPYMEAAASNHSTVAESIALITDLPQGRQVAYATKVEILRKAIEGLIHEQRTIQAERYDVEERAVEAVRDMLRPDRFPKCDEHE